MKSLSSVGAALSVVHKRSVCSYQRPSPGEATHVSTGQGKSTSEAGYLFPRSWKVMRSLQASGEQVQNETTNGHTSRGRLV
jgi:hypothetical protein